MDLDRDIRSIANKINNPSSSKNNVAPQTANSHQGIASLIVMIAVLTIIILFCCFAAPGIRGLCKRYVFRSCPYDDPERDNASTTAPESGTPTVILLPHGRMLVVDRNVLTQLHVDRTGIDFLELSANLIRAQRQQTGSTPSILDSDTTSKGISPTSLGFSPPAYEDIFGDKHLDLPPSYSEVSLVFKHHNEQMSYLRKQVQASMSFDDVTGNGDVESIELANQNNINNNNEIGGLRSQESSLIIRNPLDNHASMVLVVNNINNNINGAILTSNNEQCSNNISTYHYDNEGNIEMSTYVDVDDTEVNNLSDSVTNLCDNENVSLSDILCTDETSRDNNETVGDKLELDDDFLEDMV